MDLFLPGGAGTHPVVLLIHGGGFKIGRRDDPNIQRIGRGLAARGIAAATIDYRLIATDPEPSDRVAKLRIGLPAGTFYDAMVAAVDDSLTAIDFLRAHAGEFHLDVDRLGIVGSSAGAITADHVASTLDDHGITPPRVRFVGSLWGGILIPPPAGMSGVPAVQVDGGEAALFAVHGDADSVVPVRDDDQLAARAATQHLPVEYHRLKGAGHSFSGTKFFTMAVAGPQTSFDRLLAFASAHLG
jgi:acetyl esterase/lipase